MHKTWETTALVLGTGFGLGFSRVAPGTVGSLLGLVAVWSWQQWQLPVMAGVLMATAAILAAIPICSRAAQKFGRPDPGQVVLDEIAAFPIVFSMVAVDLTTGVAGFLWFRLFDITKPWPVRRLEKFPGGIGIVADDLAAGVYAGAALWLTVWLFGWQ